MTRRDKIILGIIFAGYLMALLPNLVDSLESTAEVLGIRH